MSPIVAIPKVRPTKEQWYMAIARVVATRADCTRRQVGSIIVDTHEHIVATGYNGAPSGKPGCLTDGACPRGRQTTDDVTPGSSYDTGPGSCIAIHAEANAIMQANPLRRRDAVMYVTDQPCDGCMRLIDGSGLRGVVWPDGTHWCW